MFFDLFPVDSGFYGTEAARHNDILFRRSG
jgi:hypothetical protein